MKNHTVVGLMLQTYQFLIIRLLINVFVFVPAYWAVINGINMGNKYLGVHMLITDIAFGYAGLVIFIGYINFMKKYCSHLVRYAQIASITAIVNHKTIKGSMMLYGFKTMFSRFGTVSMVYFSDKLISTALRQITQWVMEKDNFIPEFLKTGILSKLISSTLKAVIFSVDEVVISYMYANKEVSFWKGTTEGISLYVRSWKSILKAAFFSVLWMKIFSIIVNLSVFIFALWYLWGKGVMPLVNFLILYKIIMSLGKSTFVEPYQSISMVLGFYANKTDSQEIVGLTETLERVSAAFKDMLLRRKEMDLSVASELSNIITTNLGSDNSESPFEKINSILGRRGD